MKNFAVISIAIFEVMACRSAIAAPLLCSDLQAQIAAKLDSNGLQGFFLWSLKANEKPNGQVVGSCDGGARKIVYAKTGQQLFPEYSVEFGREACIVESGESVTISSRAAPAFWWRMQQRELLTASASGCSGSLDKKVRIAVEGVSENQLADQAGGFRYIILGSLVGKRALIGVGLAPRGYNWCVISPQFLISPGVQSYCFAREASGACRCATVPPGYPQPSTDITGVIYEPPIVSKSVLPGVGIAPPGYTWCAISRQYLNPPNVQTYCFSKEQSGTCHCAVVPPGYPQPSTSTTGVVFEPK